MRVTTLVRRSPASSTIAARSRTTPLPEYDGENFPINEIGSNTFHDLQVAYTLPWNATVAVGANNVFDHWAAPLRTTSSNSGYSYYGGYDIGRFIYMKYQQRF